MSGIDFEFDPRKDLANQRKHGVRFAEAITVFGDQLSITIPDPNLDEERLVRADPPDRRPPGDKT